MRRVPSHGQDLSLKRLPFFEESLVRTWPGDLPTKDVPDNNNDNNIQSLPTKDVPYAKMTR